MNWQEIVIEAVCELLRLFLIDLNNGFEELREIWFELFMVERAVEPIPRVLEISDRKSVFFREIEVPECQSFGFVDIKCLAFLLEVL